MGTEMNDGSKAESDNPTTEETSVLQLEIQELKEKLTDERKEFESKIKVLEKEMERRTSLWRMDREARDKHELSSRLAAMEALPMKLSEITGKNPVLWISTEDTRILDGAGLSSLNHRIRTVAPKIDLLIVTRANVDIKEFNDEDLEKIGLKRVGEGINVKI